MAGPGKRWTQWNTKDSVIGIFGNTESGKINGIERAKIACNTLQGVCTMQLFPGLDLKLCPENAGFFYRLQLLLELAPSIFYELLTNVDRAEGSNRFDKWIEALKRVEARNDVGFDVASEMATIRFQCVTAKDRITTTDANNEVPWYKPIAEALHYIGRLAFSLKIVNEFCQAAILLQCQGEIFRGFADQSEQEDLNSGYLARRLGVKLQEYTKTQRQNEQQPDEKKDDKSGPKKDDKNGEPDSTTSSKSTDLFAGKCLIRFID